jgi:FkbM family methyltransferase
MDEALPEVGRPPWYFRFAAARLRSGRRGGNFLLRNFRRAGLLEKCTRVSIGHGQSVLVPLHWKGSWYYTDLESYERAAVTAFASQIETAGAPAVLVDCGADVGIYTRHVLARARNVVRVVAFEPNPRSHALLVRNLAGLAIPAEALQAGVFDRPGRGDLQGERYQNHGAFMQAADSGGIRLYTVDELDLPKDLVLAMKVDVEGGELNVLRGAAASLARARSFVVVFEAHPDVARRTGVDPVECLKALAAARPCRWFVAERPDVALTAERPFFEQVPRDAVVNVVATSAG